MTKVDTFPADFQQLIFDLGVEAMDVLVTDSAIDGHFDELDAEADSWRKADYDKANEYREAMLRYGCDAFPPLVAQCPGGKFRDGYHRLWALREIGVSMFRIIYLDWCREQDISFTG